MQIVKNKDPSIYDDIIGKKYNRLLITGYSERKDYLVCQCDCGNIKEIYKYNIVSEKSKSCGCYSREKNTTQLGLSDSRLYSIRTGMIQRCYNENDVNYNYYGGKGIIVCEEWLNKKDGFLNFYKWSIENGYSEELTIDRIDVNEGYNPSNCRWVDYYVQGNNTSRNVRLVIDGNSMTHGEICREYGFHENLIYSRLKRGITNIKDLIAKPKIKIHCAIIVFLNDEFIGRFKTQYEVADFIGVSQAWVARCLKANETCVGYSLKREVE